MFRITESAAQQVIQAAKQSGTDGMALRLAERQKTDGSIEYVMGFDEASDDDISFKTEGVELVMEPEYVPLLDQAVMDFVELDEGEHQFVFLNPKDPHYVPPQEA